MGEAWIENTMADCALSSYFLARAYEGNQRGGHIHIVDKGSNAMYKNYPILKNNDFLLLKNTSPSTLEHWIFLERPAHRLLCSSDRTDRSDLFYTAKIWNGKKFTFANVNLCHL